MPRVRMRWTWPEAIRFPGWTAKELDLPRRLDGGVYTSWVDFT